MCCLAYLCCTRCRADSVVEGLDSLDSSKINYKMGFKFERFNIKKEEAEDITFCKDNSDLS